MKVRKAVNSFGTKLIGAIEKVTISSGIAGTVLLVLILILMLAEIVYRALTQQTLGFTWDFSTWAMAGLYFLAAPDAQRTGEHIRVGALLELLPPKLARLLDFASTLAGIYITVVISYAVGMLAYNSAIGDVRSWSGTNIPLVYPQAMVAVGATIWALQLIARAFRLILSLPGDTRHTELDSVL